MTQSAAIIIAGILTVSGVIWSQRWYRATEFAKQQRQAKLDSTIDAVQALIRLSQVFKAEDSAQWRRDVGAAVIECEAEVVRLWVFGRESRHAAFAVTEYVNEIWSDPDRTGIDDTEWTEFRNLVQLAAHAARTEIESIIGVADEEPPPTLSTR